jgi:hypothetical protein
MKEEREWDCCRAAHLESAELPRHKLAFRHREVRQQMNEYFFFLNEAEFLWKPKLNHFLFHIFLYRCGDPPANSAFSGFLPFLNRNCELSENEITSLQKRAIERLIEVNPGKKHKRALPEMGLESDSRATTNSHIG